MKIDNLKIYDLDESIKASKYPMSTNTEDCNFDITKTVKALATSPKGEGHDQFLTGIRVAFDLTCSNKMWIEMERYHYIDFVSSQSTMHKIADFDIRSQYNKYVHPYIIGVMEKLKGRYNKSKDPMDYLNLIYSNPSGFELTARITTNYRQLKTIYSQRKNHRLPEWREFCKWIETLPYAEEFILN